MAGFKASHESMDLDVPVSTPGGSGGPPVTPEKRGGASDDDLTPRKRQKVSFWPSKRLAAEKEKDIEQDQSRGCQLSDLKAGERFGPIEVRLVCKELREKILVMTVMDSTRERQAKAFKDCFQQFKDMKVNQVYKIGNFKVVPGFLGSDDEILLHKQTTAEKIDSENFAEIEFQFKGLEDLATLHDNEIVVIPVLSVFHAPDVAGIVTNIKKTTLSRNGKLKREIYLNDASKTDTSVFFWVKDTILCDSIELYSPIIIRRATKKTLKDAETHREEAVLWISWETKVMYDVVHPKTEALAKWFSEEAKAENVQLPQN